MWQWCFSVVVLQKPTPLMGPVKSVLQKVLHHLCQQKSHPWMGHWSKYLRLCQPGFAHCKKDVLALCPPLCPRAVQGGCLCADSPYFLLWKEGGGFQKGHSQHCCSAAQPFLYWVSVFDKFWVFEQIEQKFPNRNLTIAINTFLVVFYALTTKSLNARLRQPPMWPCWVHLVAIT